MMKLFACHFPYFSLLIVLFILPLVACISEQEQRPEMRFSPESKATFKSETEPIIAALTEYKSQNGKYPTTLDELERANLIALNPPSIGVKEWEYSHKTRFDEYTLSVIHENAEYYVGYECWIYQSSSQWWGTDA